jgi:transcriptional regulator with XRE-family HTH domain
MENRLRDLRKFLNLTQQEMADILELPKSRIVDIERGATKHISPEIAEKLEEKYNISSRWLLFGKGSMYLEPESSEEWKEALKKELSIQSDKELEQFLNVAKSPKGLEILELFYRARKGDREAIKRLADILKGIEFTL